MIKPVIKYDHIIFSPADVDLSFSPLRNGLKESTYVLGAFNPFLKGEKERSISAGENIK